MMLGSTLIKTICSSCKQRVSVAGFANKVDPGTRRRLKVSEDLQETDLDDLDYEANFEAVSSTYKEHMQELKSMKEKLQYDIVKQKYFKAKYPNFLTWHEKEQIKLLHKKDPEEWSIERLSEGFPALPEIIKKIIKSEWRIENVERMKKHDEKVRENWKRFKNNEFKDLPSNVVTHLRKFSNRKNNYQNYDNVNITKIEYTPKVTCTEFSDIITSYKKLTEQKEKTIAIESRNDNKINNELKMKNKKSKAEKIMEPSTKSSSEKDTFFIEKIKDTEPVTLNTLKNKLQSDLDIGKNVSYEDASIIQLSPKDLTNEATNITSSSIDLMDYTKYNTGKLMTIDEKKPKDYDHLAYPEKIKIPKKILKKGQTYKLNDCFYDSDGLFLYRVPGL